MSEVKIGRILMHRGQARHPQIEFLLNLQIAYRKHGKEMKLGNLLIEHRVITSEALATALDAQKNISHESITQILQAMEEFPTKLTKFFAD